MPKHWLKNLSHKAASIKMLQPVYGLSLGQLDDLLTIDTTPADLFGGDAGKGRWLANGHLDIQGHRIVLDCDTWYLKTIYEGTPYFDKLHGFEFLSELKSLGGDAGRRCARTITEKWLNDFQNYHHDVWEPQIAAIRLVNWLTAYNFAYETARDEFVESFHTCIYKHYYHLKNTLGVAKNLDGYDRFYILHGLITAQCHIRDFYDEVEIQSYLQLLNGTVKDLILPDGGVIDRNVYNMAELLKALFCIRQSLQTRSIPIPLWLTKTIETSLRTLNLLTHGDKDIALIQGATLSIKSDIERLNKLSNLRFRRTDTMLDKSGYTSMRKGRTSIIIDHGDKGAHISPFAFEVSHGAYRFIVNCGTYTLDTAWQESLSGINAHSCLNINNTDPKQNFIAPKTTLDSVSGASLFSGTHKGYEGDHGITHTRRIYLNSDGEDIRGEDLLVRNLAVKSLPYITRFHLHPTVKASLIDNQSAVLLRLPKGIGWTFQSNHGVISLEETVYCPDGLSIRKSQQIVVQGDMDDISTQIKWAFKKQ